MYLWCKVLATESGLIATHPNTRDVRVRRKLLEKYKDGKVREEDKFGGTRVERGLGNTGIRMTSVHRRPRCSSGGTAS